MLRSFPLYSPLLTAWLLLLATLGYAMEGEAPRIQIALGHTEPVIFVAADADRKFLVSAGMDRRVKLWNMSSGQELQSLTISTSPLLAVAASRDARKVAATDSDSFIRIAYEFDPKRVISLKTDGLVYSLAFSKGDNGLLWVDDSGAVKKYDETTGAVVEVWRYTSHRGQSARLSPDGNFLVYFSGGKLCRGEISSRKSLSILPALSDIINWRLSAGGQHVATWNEKGQTVIQDFENSALLASFSPLPPIDENMDSSGRGYLPNSKTWISCAEFSSDGSRFYLGTFHHVLLSWNLAASAPEWVQEIPGIPWCLDTSDTMQLICGSADFYSQAKTAANTLTYTGFVNEIINIRASDGETINRFSGQNFPIVSGKYFKDGKRIAVAGSDKSLKIWDLSTGNILALLSGHKEEVRDIVLSADNRSIISCAWDGTIRVWDVEGRKCRKVIHASNNHLDAIALSPDESLLAAVDFNGKLSLWSTVDWSLHRSIETGISSLLTLSWSPDGKSIACGGSAANVDADQPHGVLALIDTQSGNIRASATLDKFSVRKVCYAEDGKRLYFCRGEMLVSCADSIDLRLIWTSAPFKGETVQLAFADKGKRILVSDMAGKLSSLDSSTGRVLENLIDFQGSIFDIDISPNGHNALLSGRDCAFRIFDLATNSILASGMADPSGARRLIWTEDGYYMGSQDGLERFASIVKGRQGYDFNQFIQQRYRPDIVTGRLTGKNSTAKESISLIKGFSTPPSLSIKLLGVDDQFYDASVDSQNHPVKIVNGSIRVRLEASDQGGGISGIRLYVNGKAQAENLRGLHSVDTSELIADIALRGGDNIIKAIGFSSDQTASTPVEALVRHAAAQNHRPSLWILAIGINEYKNPTSRLNYAVGDVNGFLESLRSPAMRLFERVDIRAIKDLDARKPIILQAFKDIASQAEPDDVFIFFYAGHGIAIPGATAGTREFLYILQDMTQMTDIAQVSGSALTGAEFRACVMGIKAQKQFYILDACNSGALTDAFTARGLGEEIALANLGNATGAAMIAASQANQAAQEFASLGHGALTQALMDGIGGKAVRLDRQISVLSLIAWVQDSLPAIALRHAGEPQYPRVWLNGQDFPIGLSN